MNYNGKPYFSYSGYFGDYWAHGYWGVNPITAADLEGTWQERIRARTWQPEKRDTVWESENRSVKWNQEGRDCEWQAETRSFKWETTEEET